MRPSRRRATDRPQACSSAASVGFTPVATPTTSEQWIGRAREVAATLAQDVIERDAANQTPHVEVELLRTSGLVTLRGPREHGGGGQSMATAQRVVREVARVDGSIAQLLGYSYLWSSVPRLVGTAEQADRLEAEATRNRWLWGGVANPRDPDLQVRDTGDHLVFDGRKTFCTGATVADVVVLQAIDPHGSGIPLQVMVPGNSAGLVPLGDWDNLGVRLSDSGGIEVHGVRGEWANALGWRAKTYQPHLSNLLLVPILQLVFANLYVGIGLGAVSAAAEYTRTKTRPALQTTIERAVDDPYILEIYGELSADLWAAEALTERAGDELQAALDDVDALTERRRGEIAVLVAAAKVRAIRASLEATSKIFEATGARATARKAGFDRYWRDVRTHSLHDWTAYKLHEIGVFVLRDEIPTPTWYT